jgi:hypothetical protein
MGARLLARAGSDVGEGDQRAEDPESARVSELYATAIRESAGRLGCVWVVGREKTKNLPGSIDGIPPLLPPSMMTMIEEEERDRAMTVPDRHHHRSRAAREMAETIPVDVDLTSISGPRPIITSRHRRESRSRIQQAQVQAMQPAPSEPPPFLLKSTPPAVAPPPPPPRSLLAQVSARPPKSAPGGALQMMAITSCTTFLLIVAALFVAEYRGMPVHAMIESTGQAIAQAVRHGLSSLAL